jgi:hypothetical protein
MNAAPRRPAQGDPLALPNEILVLEIHRIRRDGDTQGRVALNESIIQEYANLMRAGVEFPPVRTWFDGCAYWLSDGFQRMAAAELVGLNQISAEVFRGTLEDARWDSYAANAAHGLRRTRADIEVIIRRAVEHPKGSQISSRELARHLGMPEPTLRRWRKRVSASPDADTTRVAIRAGRAYLIDTVNIKKSGELRRRKQMSLDNLRGEFNMLKQLASPQVEILFAILGSWLFDGGPATVCLDRVEEAVRNLSSTTGRER